MRKYLIQTVICVLLVFTLSMNVSAYHIVGLSNFDRNEIYTENTFTDVNAGDWFADDVCAAFEYGLMNGTENGFFSPQDEITLAETIAIAAQINHIYYHGSEFYISSDNAFNNWYDPYVSYAQDNDIIDSDYPNYVISATRAQFAEILVNSIDSIDIEPINIVDDAAIPDVTMTDDYAEAVYMLYRAGVLTGSDSKGTFNPNFAITRAEAAAVITRMVDVNLRKSIELTGEY